VGIPRSLRDFQARGKSRLFDFSTERLFNSGQRRGSFRDGFNRALIYMGACMIAGIRLAREKQVNVRVIPTSNAIDESVELAHEIFNRVFRKVPDKLREGA
jgi:hypothetical protein